MNGTLHFAYDESVWTFIPRVWPDPVAGRSVSRWASRTARAVLADSEGGTREQGRWFGDLLEHFATRTHGDAALWFCMPRIGGPFLAVQVLATEADGDLDDLEARSLVLEVPGGALMPPETMEDSHATGLGTGKRATFTTDDGEGGEQVGVVWVFRSGDTDVRISVVGVYPDNFTALEPWVQEFIDHIIIT